MPGRQKIVGLEFAIAKIVLEQQFLV